MLRWLSLFLLCLLPLTATSEEIAVPALTARVTDLTGTLTAEQRATLESKLQALEAQKGSQISVLLVPTTGDETIEQYSIRVVEQWKLGRKKVDDGVLLLIAKNNPKFNRRIRIDVGYGLEGALPDAIAKRIIAEDITPHFKQGDFYGGIVAGITRIDAVIKGEQLPPPAQRSSNSNSSGMESYLFFLIIFALISGSFLRRILGTLPGGLVNGGLIGLITLFIGGGILFAIIFGIIAFVFSLINSGNSGGFGGGGFGGGGGFSGGGGGFSGGGGGFGGGGASGDW